MSKPEPRYESSNATVGVDGEHVPAMVRHIYRDEQGNRVTEFVGTFANTTRDCDSDAAICAKALATHDNVGLFLPGEIFHD